MIYTVPHFLESTLLSYVKKTYLPEKRLNPKTANEFTKHDVNFFAEGIAEMSDYFTSDRSQLPKNYLNKKELRAGYLLYFVMTNFLKVSFCLKSLKPEERFKDKAVVKIADVGCGPGTASLACADLWRGKKQKIEITSIDQNKNALHDARKIFQNFAAENASLKNVFSYLTPKSISFALKDKFDIIIAANFLSEVGDIQKQAQIVEKLLAHHLNEKGVLIIIEPALRLTTRNLMKLHDELLASANVIAPCLHNLPCPMLKESDRDWCHMYLDWKRPDIIARIDALIGNRKDYLKFSYLILNLPSNHPTIRPSNQWRAVSAPMPSNGKIELLLCNEHGILRVTRLNKNLSQVNEDFGNVQRGDMVTFSGTPRIEKDTPFKIVQSSP